MSNFEAKPARDEDPDQDTILENANGNPVAKTEAQMAVEAAHRALMGDRAINRDKNENAVEEKNK